MLQRTLTFRDLSPYPSPDDWDLLLVVADCYEENEQPLQAEALRWLRYYLHYPITSRCNALWYLDGNDSRVFPEEFEASYFKYKTRHDIAVRQGSIATLPSLPCFGRQYHIWFYSFLEAMSWFIDFYFPEFKNHYAPTKYLYHPDQDLPSSPPFLKL